MGLPGAGGSSAAGSRVPPGITRFGAAGDPIERACQCALAEYIHSLRHGPPCPTFNARTNLLNPQRPPCAALAKLTMRRLYALSAPTPCCLQARPCCQHLCIVHAACGNDGVCHHSARLCRCSVTPFCTSQLCTHMFVNPHAHTSCDECTPAQLRLLHKASQTSTPAALWVQQTDRKGACNPCPP